jgi:hypothetical protein
MKKFIGKVITISFTDKKEEITGIVVDYNKDWTLMKHLPFDYEIDGYILFRHKNIIGYKRGEEEKFKEKILKLKKQDLIDKSPIIIDNIETILKDITQKFRLFLFYLKSEKICYVGNVYEINNKILTINNLDTRGKWLKKRDFRINDIRVIQFDCDYVNSLKLVAKKIKTENK